jgi:hypothetical protein
VCDLVVVGCKMTPAFLDSSDYLFKLGIINICLLLNIVVDFIEMSGYIKSIIDGAVLYCQNVPNPKSEEKLLRHYFCSSTAIPCW